MSFLLSTGADAVNDALTEKVDHSKALVSLKAGKVFKVRVLKEAVVRYMCHSVYKVFYSTPCTKPMGKEDLYDKATDLLYKDAKAAEEAGASEKEVEAMRNTAYQLKAKERYMIGFINLEDGKPIVIDFTSKQGKLLVKAIKKYEKNLDKFAFELTKTGAGNETQVSFSLILDMDEDLKEGERKHFEESAGHEFDMSIFENVLQVNDEAKQLEDLVAFGFDVTRLGFEAPNATGAGEEKKEEDEDF